MDMSDPMLAVDFTLAKVARSDIQKIHVGAAPV